MDAAIRLCILWYEVSIAVLQSHNPRKYRFYREYLCQLGNVMFGRMNLVNQVL